MKTIYTMCVDQEHGKHIAFNDDGGIISISESYTSTDEAVGRLVAKCPDLFQVRVVVVDEVPDLRG